MTGRCEVCGEPAPVRLRVATYPHRRGPLGWLLAKLAWSSAAWRWACVEHAAEAMRTAVNPDDEGQARQ